eukprot:4421847-Amphidinium_carterae.1
MPPELLEASQEAGLGNVYDGSVGQSSQINSNTCTRPVGFAVVLVRPTSETTGPKPHEDRTGREVCSRGSAGRLSYLDEELIVDPEVANIMSYRRDLQHKRHFKSQPHDKVCSHNSKRVAKCPLSPKRISWWAAIGNAYLPMFALSC